MSIHKLTAGSGYDYLTRQVAALDATEKGHVGLASYYTERGETPGVWVGSGMVRLGGLSAGDVVTAEQMKALFGSGLHPLAGERQQAQVPGADPTGHGDRAEPRLGLPFKVYADDVSPFRVEVAKRIAALNQVAGLPGDWPVPAGERAEVRTAVAREFFTAENGRPPADARELASTIARLSRPKTQAVAGYDLTFSPVKSVSTLWAVAPRDVAAAIERAHRAAVQDALTFLETRALFTRTGANGVRQVDVQGVVAAAFTHRDSRAGDPDLHTHVAVANKVQTLDGRWLSVDGRVLFKATVAASETYNTALEHHLHDTLGVRFEERTNPDPRLRSVREIVGVNPALNERWSARRAVIDIRRGELAGDFQRDHGRPPTPVEALQLAQRATLETREAKHEPRSLAEQRATWQAQARDVLGGPGAVASMVRTVLSPTRPARSPADEGWVSRAAVGVVASLEERRSTWQVWHVRAEAQRRVRFAHVPTDHVEPLVDRVVAEVLNTRSVALAPPSDGVSEPAVLRRADGSSVYTVAGASLYTSARVLAAEQRLVATAGRHDGHTIDAETVDAALLESTVNGITLNAGQAAMVRELATSGARLQLAIAPAGAGKTTAMQALATAWTTGGGTVLGLAPSAAAAAVLRDQLRTHTHTHGDPSDGPGPAVVTETLAKLTWSLQHGDLPEWASGIGRSTLVVVDEAGMADTLSLDTVVGFVVGRGGSVRLVGDDQQLAAIGAGGVLRDIAATHGAVRLTELLRFADPAEGAASLALRDGQPEALGFYLDHHRVHVGDRATVTDQVFTAWQSDRDHGIDAIMLAPTRKLVTHLNHRARTHRLTTTPTTNQGAAREGGDQTVALADGNHASVGDLIITRANDRRLRVSGTDWVKNGDRWTIQAIADTGDLRVRHTQHRLIAHLPAGYVQSSVELGYATTVHTAQGVSADTMHGLAGGEESRQQLYTMMTRGRNANHLYLQVVGDGDPHTVITPEMVTPSTPTDLLEQILARDDTPQSATTQQREQHHPAVRLGEAAARYTDALHAAAEDVAGPNGIEALDGTAERTLPGLTDEPAWPTLRAHLLLLAADGADPELLLQDTAQRQPLGDADDRAAVIDWRLDRTRPPRIATGPLPWLPAIPKQIADHPTWGAYLAARSQLVADLAQQVRQQTHDDPAPWTQQAQVTPPPHLVADVEVWRAAMQVDPSDLRPTGQQQLQHSAATWQRHLDHCIADETPACQEWKPLIEQLAPGSLQDRFVPVLASRLAAVSRSGVNAHALLQSAARTGPLPDDHAAAALWWRISRHLTPAVANQGDPRHTLTTPWTGHLTTILGDEYATQLQSSQWWPLLVTAIDHAIARGWLLKQLFNSSPPHPDHIVDDCQQLVWRISVLTDSLPEDDPIRLLDDTPVDYQPLDNARYLNASGNDPQPQRFDHEEFAEGVVAEDDPRSARADDDRWLNADLAVAAMIRDHAGPPELTDSDIARMIDRATEWQESPVAEKRMLEINQLTWTYYRNQFPHSWARDYLTARLHQDLTDHPKLHAGHAPAGWTHLIDHLRRHGVADHEMTVTGVATTASTGRLIDRFRDRVMFPITDHDKILGFVGRRHPDLTDQDQGGPKYLNTADTPLFHKGAQLYCPAEHFLTQRDIPVIVEGPVDALAVTIATHERRVGVAPLGTTLTDEQAAKLARYGVNPVVATDGDLPGRVAAERHYWILAGHRLNPIYAQLPEGSDPASLLADYGAEALKTALAAGRPLSDLLIEERIAHLPADQAICEAARVVAASPTNQWDRSSDRISDQLQLPLNHVRRNLLEFAKDWTANPRQAALPPLRNTHQVKERLAAAATDSGRDWITFAGRLDPRLPHEDDWPALRNLLQTAHRHGIDVDAVSQQLLAQAPLNQRPAQDLKYRLMAAVDATGEDATSDAAHPGRREAINRRAMPGGTSRTPPQLPNRGTHR